MPCSYRVFSGISNWAGFADELIYNPNVTVNALLYQGKYIEVWFKEFLTDKLLVRPVGQLTRRDVESCWRRILKPRTSAPR